MSDLISESTPKARKDHKCMACDFLRDGLNEVFDCLDYSEKRDVVKARRNGWKVVAGETYTRQFCKDGGYIFAFKAITAIHGICIDHGLYPED